MRASGGLRKLKTIMGWCLRRWQAKAAMAHAGEQFLGVEPFTGAIRMSRMRLTAIALAPWAS